MSDKKFNELNDNEQKFMVEHLRIFSENRQSIFLNAQERIIKYLFIINTGSVATLLTYISEKNHCFSYVSIFYRFICFYDWYSNEFCINFKRVFIKL